MFTKLKKEMARQGISGYRLAKLTGISSPDIYRVLNGKIYLYSGWQKRIADALGCSVDELFPKGGGDDEQK